MPMFSTDCLSRVLRPHGLECKVHRINPPGDGAFPEMNVPIDRVVSEEDWYEMIFWGRTPGRQQKNIVCHLYVSLPSMKGGVFLWGDRERTVVTRCFQDLTVQPGKREWKFHGPGYVIIRLLQSAFAGALRDFYFTGTPPSSEAVRSKVNRIFSSSRWCPVVPRGSMGKKSLKELVYMDLPDTIDLEVLKFPPELTGTLDPCSTTQGGKINKAYRMCQGAIIDTRTGKYAPSKVRYCSTLADNAIGIDLAPHRANLLRTSFEASLDLLNPEDPWVAGEMHDLSGVHLLTALMEQKWWTWEDCIAISETAAVKLKALRPSYEVVTTFGPLELKVKEGDQIMPRGHVLGIGLSREGERIPFLASNLKHHAWVEKITACKTHLMGRPAIRYRFHLMSHLFASTGDKLTTRAGTKGVVMVLPDSQMPVLQDGRRVECCLSPSSVVGRKAMLVHWEMMMNKRQEAACLQHIYPHGEQLGGLQPAYPDLVEEGWGAPNQLFLKDQPLQHKTFVGPLYFIRVDKIASEIASVQSGKRRVNHHGVPVDSARLSGQRRDLSKAMAFASRGLHHTLTDSIRRNVSGAHYVRSIASVLEPERYLEGG
jgi:hypothetical protein